MPSPAPDLKSTSWVPVLVGADTAATLGSLRDGDRIEAVECYRREGGEPTHVSMLDGSKWRRRHYHGRASEKLIPTDGWLLNDQLSILTVAGSRIARAAPRFSKIRYWSDPDTADGRMVAETLTAIHHLGPQRLYGSRAFGLRPLGPKKSDLDVVVTASAHVVAKLVDSCWQGKLTWNQVIKRDRPTSLRDLLKAARWANSRIVTPHLTVDFKRSSPVVRLQHRPQDLDTISGERWTVIRGNTLARNPRLVLAPPTGRGILHLQLVGYDYSGCARTGDVVSFSGLQTGPYSGLVLQKNGHYLLPDLSRHPALALPSIASEEVGRVWA